MRRPQQPTPPPRPQGPDPTRAGAVSAAAPSPLPEAAPSDADTAVDVETLDDWAHGGADSSAERPAGRGGLSRADDAADEDGSAAPGDDAEPVDRVGVFDVWRAARARRRRLRSEARRFTARTRRRRILWAVSLGAVALVAAGSFAVAYSPLFAVEKVTVLGTSSLDAATVTDALDAQRGVPLAAVDASAIKAELVKFPLIETYAVEARPPHELVVRIVERTPVGVIRSDAGYTLVDAAGVALATTPEAPAGQPELTAGDVGSKSFRAAGLVVRSLPQSVREQVTAVTAKTANDVTLTLASGAQVIWGSNDRSSYKALVLERTMAVPAAAEATVFDVSSPDAVVVR